MIATPATPLGPTTRVGSVDLVRGVTILAMLYVNDVAGVHGAPPWMKHIEPSTADGLTFVDVVFPAFLFIVGLSLPVALERRMAEGGRGLRLWWHILLRTLGLLMIGVLMVNSESISEAGPISGSLWKFLMYLGVILAWLAPLDAANRSHHTHRLKLLGAALLVVLVFLYRSREMSHGLVQLRPH